MSARRKNKDSDSPSVGALEIISNIEVSRNGQPQWLNDALNVAVSEALAATEKYGKESTVTLTFSINKLESGRAAVGAKLAEKIAKGVTTPVTVYTNTKGEMFFENPYQPKLQGLDSNEDLAN